MITTSHVDDALYAFLSTIDHLTRDDFDARMTGDPDERRMLQEAMSAALEAGQSRRIQELLEANNAYMDRARRAEAALNG